MSYSKLRSAVTTFNLIPVQAGHAAASTPIAKAITKDSRHTIIRTSSAWINGTVKLRSGVWLNAMYGRAAPMNPPMVHSAKLSNWMSPKMVEGPNPSDFRVAI